MPGDVAWRRLTLRKRRCVKSIYNCIKPPIADSSWQRRRSRQARQDGHRNAAIVQWGSAMKNDGFGGLIFFIVLAVLIVNVFSPKTVWNLLYGWKYRDPKANEPSEMVYLLIRIASIVTLVFGVASFVNKYW
jgi:hypothetical protein